MLYKQLQAWPTLRAKGKSWVKARESLKNKVMPEINFEELIEVILVPKIEKRIPDRSYSHVQSHGDPLEIV